MEADRNKTNLTHAVTEAAAAWLDRIGAEIIETEVTIAPKWVADIAAVWSPTRTEAANAKLIPRTLSYPGCFEKDKDKVAKYEQRQREREEAYGSIPSPVTIACEVKTSVGDFRKDTKWRRVSPVDMRVLSVTKEIFDRCDMPPGWWILIHASTGRLVRIIPHWFTPVSDDRVAALSLAVARRRCNRTKYAFEKQLQRRVREDEAARRTSRRLDALARAVLEIATATERPTMVAACRYYLGRDWYKLSRYTKRSLARLWAETRKAQA